MQTIIAFHGEEVLVDDVDFDWLNQFKWHVARGYAQRCIGLRKNNRRVDYNSLMHREIMGLVKGDGLICDHINRNRLDNRRENLRIVTYQQNTLNLSKKTNTTSKYLGVYFTKPHLKKPWKAGIKIGGKLHYLGYFATEEEASQAYQEAKAKYHVF